MLKIYPKKTIQKKLEKTFCVALMVAGVALACAVYGKVKDDSMLLMDGLGFALVSVLIFKVGIVRIVGTFKRSNGGVLEVQDGKVKRFHSEPFVYKAKDVGAPGKAELVPFSLAPINVSQTIIAAVDDNVLFYKVECSVIPNSFSQYYDSFLHPVDLREGEVKTPQDVAESQVYNFLWHARASIVERHRLLYGTCEECMIQQETGYEAKIYLNEQLGADGLTVFDLTSTYLVRPFLIDKER